VKEYNIDGKVEDRAALAELLAEGVLLELNASSEIVPVGRGLYEHHFPPTQAAREHFADLARTWLRLAGDLESDQALWIC
jgi:hypothetical protein